MPRPTILRTVDHSTAAPFVTRDVPRPAAARSVAARRAAVTLCAAATALVGRLAHAQPAVHGASANSASTAPAVLTDSAAGELAAGVLPPLAAPARATRPATIGDVNVPGAPNLAGHVSEPLARDEVVAPLVATVGGGSGPEVLHVQVLLDAARFSPGAVSGVWNENTVFAIRAFRGVVGLPAGDSADADVVAKLERVVGARAALTTYTVTAADVAGPYHPLPGSIYAKAKLDCLCYTSMLEMLSERFHTTRDVIRQLNPDVDPAHAPAGTRLTVPNVVRGAAPAVARLVVDRREGSMRGVDARGATRFWLPVTVGSPSEPSPKGRLHVVSASPMPRYHYNPLVLGDVPDWKPEAMIAPGPNSPVGVLWAQLSQGHVGLHGTPDPEDIGYTMSHGCVRLANWDARWITPLLKPGLPVDFQ